MGGGQEEDDKVLDQGSSLILHCMDNRGLLHWVELFFFPLLSVLVVYIISVDDKIWTPWDLVIIGGCLIGLVSAGWLGFSLEGPGEIRMDLLGIQFSRRWHKMSTEWTNVTRIRWAKPNRELMFEFANSPVRWYEIYRWGNMLFTGYGGYICLDDKRWALNDINEMAEYSMRMLGQDEIEETPPEV